MLFVQSGYEISNGKSYIVILREKQPDLFLVTGYCVNATEEGRLRVSMKHIKIKKTHFTGEVRNFRQCDWKNKSLAISFTLWVMILMQR